MNTSCIKNTSLFFSFRKWNDYNCHSVINVLFFVWISFGGDDFECRRWHQLYKLQHPLSERQHSQRPTCKYLFIYICNVHFMILKSTLRLSKKIFFKCLCLCREILGKISDASSFLPFLSEVGTKQGHFLMIRMGRCLTGESDKFVLCLILSN